LAGHPAWVFTIWNQDAPNIADLKNLFMQEMSRNGVLMIATHNVTAAHDEASFQTIVDAYRAALTIVKRASIDGDAKSRLDVEVAELAPRVR
jgi:glutamate-1-semialdehyde 2,1-aminomutase